MDDDMNTFWVLSNLRDAHEELTRTIARIESAPTSDEIEFEIALAHMYHHLNTAWNSRRAGDQQIAVQSEEDFYNWRAYPTDIAMARPASPCGEDARDGGTGTMRPARSTFEVAEIVHIAQQDAETVYGDLSAFKITLTPSSDGWHVDYELTDPLSAGGGPHYVIDPHTGDIVSRRYEQ